MNIWCGHYQKYGYRLHVGHPVLGKLYDHFRLAIGKGLIACDADERLAWEVVVMAYYAAMYKKQYGHKLELTSHMQELRLIDIIEQSDVEAAKAIITAKTVEKLRKDGKSDSDKISEGQAME